jgi:F0F1-type ATP synthase assembly protein I
MWRIADIAYVIPVTVFLGYWLGKFLDNKFGIECLTYCVMGFAILGFVLTFFKIKKFVDACNSGEMKSCAQDLSKSDDQN